MEGDDATVACIAFHVIDDVVCRNPLGVVACHQVPHHNFEVFPEPVVLTPAHHSVRGTEEVGVYKLVGLEGVDDVGYRPVLEGSQVVIGVVAYLVTFGLDALIELRVFIDIIAHREWDRRRRSDRRPSPTDPFSTLLSEKSSAATLTVVLLTPFSIYDLLFGLNSQLSTLIQAST